METPNFRLLFFLSLGTILFTMTGSSQEGGETTDANAVAPTLYYIRVSGDEDQYQADWWTPDGWSGGPKQLTLHDTYENDVTLSFDGRVIVPAEDYKFKIEVKRPDVGFIRGKYSERRKYFDGTGGSYIPFDRPPLELRNDLYMDIGDFYLEAGLNIPDRPNITAAYDHQIKKGNKSSTEWGAVSMNGTTRNIFPAFKAIDEETDVFKLQIDHTIGDVYVVDTLQYERYETNTTKFEEERNLDSRTAETVTVDEMYDHDAFFNTFHLETRLNETFFFSMGYLFSRLEGNAGFRMQTVPFGPEPFDKDWLTRQVTVDRKAHVINGNVSAGPYKNFRFYGGVQAETNETKGDADAVLTEIAFDGTMVSPEAIISSQSEEDSIEETAGIRYTGLPFTTTYVEGKWVQSKIELSETEFEDGTLGFKRKTDTDVNRERYTLGISTFPFRNSTFSIRYRESRRNNDYDHSADTETGYSAFITDQTFDKEDISARLTFRPATGLQLSLSHRFLAIDTETGSDTTPPSSVRSGNYDASIYGIGFTLTPSAKSYLTGLFSYHDAKTTSFDNGVPSVLTFEGDVFEMLTTAGFAIDQDTDLKVEYLFSRSDNFENNSADGLPLGLDNERNGFFAALSRNIDEKIIIRLRYGYYSYDEGNSRDHNDYEAHLLGACLELRF